MQKTSYYTGETISDIIFPDVCKRRIAQVVRNITPIPGYRAVNDRNTGRTFAIVKNGYELVPHEEVIQGMDDMCTKFPEYGTPKREIWLTNYGGRMKARWTFTDVDFAIGTLSDGTPDTVHPTLETMCSYDTTLAHRTLVGGFRLVCTNGMVVGKILGEYKRKHTIGLNLDAAKQVLTNGMENYSKAANLWLSYTERKATMAEVVAYESIGFQQLEQRAIENKIREQGNVLKWDDDDKSNCEVEINAWDLFNIYTDEASHQIADINRQTKVQDAIAHTFH